MDRYTNFEKWDMLEIFIQARKNSTVAAELYFQKYPERVQPNIKTYKRLEKNLKSCGSFKANRPHNYKTAKNEENIVNVLASVNVNAKISTREISKDMGVPKTTVLRVLKQMKFKPYKTHVVQHLYPNDYLRRIEFCRFFLQKCADNQFPLNIMWTDECFISSNGDFNKKNDHNWAKQNPHVIREKQNQGRFGLNVWCCLLGEEVLAYHLFYGNLTANNYIHILQHILEPILDNISLAKRSLLWF